MYNFNSDLLRDLAEQRVVLFLGAGVSASAVVSGKPAFKGWGEFLRTAARSRRRALKDQVSKLIDSKDYLLACQLLQDDYEDSWQDLVTAEYGKLAEPSRLHRSLISLGQRIIITTNFDKLMETALSQMHGNGFRSFKVLSKIDNQVFRSLKDFETPYLIKLHGSIDNSTNLIFSRSEYIRMAFGNENYASFLDAVLLNYTILFVGFSMDDPAIASLMELYALKYPDARPHYIVQPKGMPKNIININKRLRKLAAIEYACDSTHSKLPDLIDAMSERTEAEQKKLIATKLMSVNKISSKSLEKKAP